MKRDLALDHAAGRLDDKAYLAQIAVLREEATRIDSGTRAGRGIAPDKVVARLRALPETRARATPEGRAELLHSFREHRDEYYRLLGQVRIDGDWEAWVDFFLEGVEQTARGAVETANRLLELMRRDRVRVVGLLRSAGAGSRVFSVLCERPIASVGDAASRLGVSLPTATRGIEALASLGIVSEITGRQRSRLYAYDEYLSILTREPAA